MKHYFQFSYRLKISANVLGLCEGGEIEVQMFNLAPKFNRSTLLKFSTIAPLLQNPCWWQLFFLVTYLFVLNW